MALIAVCVVVESWGPPFYRAVRVGRGGRELYVLKFRKMRRGASGPPLTLVEDERFTRIGRWLASTKLDELPQLFNVVLAQMSLVGPRPEDRRFVERHREAFEPILAVRPGITGLSQLAFAAESRILDPHDRIRDYEERILPQKVALDTLYVARWHLLLDLRILCWTFVRTVLSIPVSVDRSTGRIKVRSPEGGRRNTGIRLRDSDVLSDHRSQLNIVDLQPKGDCPLPTAPSASTEVPT
jgi:lipopolysaccharide/colanic/teichoic acid biosynthesis glycosyltransferase